MNSDKPDPARVRPATTVAQRRVLVADDDSDLAHSMVTILRAEGFDAQYVYTGLDAVTMTRRWQPQVVLLDLTMSQGSGWEVASTLRSGLAPDCLLIAHSALDAPEDIERCIEAGFDAHFAKPCDIDSLLQVLRGYYSIGDAWRQSAAQEGGRLKTFPATPR
ncbi:response regulator [Pararobbsia alpina]|nr:response regulator [Pararobbsia alpina]